MINDYKPRILMHYKRYLISHAKYSVNNAGKIIFPYGFMFIRSEFFTLN